ncbi:efflux RND transporter periplasmic adaptor subunit [bacterium]|nr:efflux RND transporter periplasmic adaptor subunit [bacterium]
MKILSILALFILIFFNQACNKNTPESATDEQKPADTDSLITLNPEAQKLASIKTEPVAFRSLVGQIELPGTIQANETRLTHVTSRLSGRVISVTAAPGDSVRKGQQLAVIDSVELGKAESEFITANAKLVVAEKAYERAKTLLAGKVIGTGEFQRREGEYLATKADAQAAENQLHLLGLSQGEVTSLIASGEIRSRVPISSPLAGTVIQRHVTMGELVDSTKELFTVADLSMVWGIADIPEQEISKIIKGAIAQVRVAAYPEEIFEGNVMYISDTLDASSRTIKARVEISNAHKKLKPEMFATFQIVIDEGQKSLAIPESSVQRDGNQTIVFVAQATGFERRPVQLGRRAGGYQEVVDGLQAGEKVVTQGAFVLKSEALKEQMEEE